jgi:hypothetical protein
LLLAQTGTTRGLSETRLIDVFRVTLYACLNRRGAFARVENGRQARGRAGARRFHLPIQAISHRRSGQYYGKADEALLTVDFLEQKWDVIIIERQSAAKHDVKDHATAPNVDFWSSVQPRGN